MKKLEQDEMAKATSQRRIRALVDKYFNGNKQDFAKAVGINKASVTQYTNGANAPGNMNAAKIAKYFHLNPLWVMGFDVPEELQEERALSTIESGLIDDFRELSEDEKKMVLLFVKTARMVKSK